MIFLSQIIFLLPSLAKLFICAKIEIRNIKRKKLCWKISLPKHALITTIYLYYIHYVFITCLYVMFYQSSTIYLLWDYMCNFTVCVISVCPSRAHNCNKIYLIIWFDYNLKCMYKYNFKNRKYYKKKELKHMMNTKTNLYL